MLKRHLEEMAALENALQISKAISALFPAAFTSENGCACACRTRWVERPQPDAVLFEIFDHARGDWNSWNFKDVPAVIQATFKSRK